MSDQLQEFKSFVKETNGLIVWAVGAGVLGAVAAHFAGVAPPWPDAATPLTCAALFLVLMYVFLQHRGLNKASAQRRFSRSAVVLVLCLLLYLLIYSLVVVRNPATTEHLVTGFYCTAEARRIYKDCPFLTQEHLAQANYQVHLLWTSWSHSVSRIVLFSLWLATFCLFMYSSAVFVIYTKGRRSFRRV